MTNAEKYKEVFGLEPDLGGCPTLNCSKCPCYKCNGEFCNSHDWWNEEYKEVVDNG